MSFFFFFTLPEPVNRSAAAREFRLLQAAMHSNAAYRDAVRTNNNNNNNN